MGFYFTNPVTGPIHTAQRLPQGRYEGAGTVRGVRCLRRNGLGRRHGVRGAEGTRLQRAPTGAASQGAQSYLSRRVLMGRNAEYTRYNRYKARFYASPRFNRGCSTLLASFHADHKRVGGSLRQTASLEKARVEFCKLTNPTLCDHTVITTGVNTSRKSNVLLTQFGNY